MHKLANGRWKLVLNIATFLALAILIIAVRRQIFLTIDNLRRVDFWVLPAMLVWQAINYHSYTRLYMQYFKILGEHIRYKSMLRVTMEVNFINTVFPSGGVSSFSYFSLRMKDAGVSGTKSTLVQLIKFISIFLSFQILLVAGLLMLAIGGSANRLTILVAGSLATLLVVSTFGLANIIGSKSRINSFFTFLTKLVNKSIYFFRRQKSETISIAKARENVTTLHENYLMLKSDWRALKAPLLWALAANTTEILTIYTVYVAFGQFVNPGAVILAYAVASFAGFMSVLPGGVGIFEALMTGVLAAAGVSPGLSIPVTIMYRILNMLIQLPPGYYFYNKNMQKKKPA